MCTSPPSVSNAIHIPVIEVYVEGERVFYQCVTGYTSTNTDNSMVVCTDIDGRPEWVGSHIECNRSEETSKCFVFSRDCSCFSAWFWITIQTTILSRVLFYILYNNYYFLLLISNVLSAAQDYSWFCEKRLLPLLLAFFFGCLFYMHPW